MASLLGVTARRGLSARAEFELGLNKLTLGAQTIFAGTQSLAPFSKEVATYSKRPLIVTDEGVARIGAVEEVTRSLSGTASVFSGTQPNPTHKDVVNIANAFFQNNCDSVIGLGGGGPLDAAKAGMALVAHKRLNPNFDINAEGGRWMDEIRGFLGRTQKDAKVWEAYRQAVPGIAGVPTTAGTGSEGGKSAVIGNTAGVKVVFGNPVFLPRTVALVPQFTVKLPPHLTAATGIDALFHSMEAFFVTYKAALADGMNDEEIKVTDDFALKGIQLVLANLPKAFKRGDDLHTRLNMQVAALYGAKAFRKGDLGGIHASAHAIGSLYHIHHGTAIARMAVPVLEHNQTCITEETKKAFSTVHALFNKSGQKGATLAESVKQFITLFNIPLGLAGLPVKEGDLATLAKLAAADPCQTNPVPLTLKEYSSIFQAAAKYQ